MANGSNLFMPKKKARVPPRLSAPAPPTSAAPAGPSLKALGKQRAIQRSASPAVAVVSGPSEVGQDLQGRTYEEYDIFSMGTPPALSLTHGDNLGADFNVIRLYQLNSASPVPDLAHPIGPIYMNRQNPNDRPLLAAVGEQERRDKNDAREAMKKAVQNGPNGEWRVPIMDREMNHQIDQRTGEKMWRVVQDPNLVAPEARKSDNKDNSFDGNRRRRGGGGGGGGRGGRGRDVGAKVYARSGNFKDGEASARNHQELNREKLPLVIEGTFPNPEYQPDQPDRLDSRGDPIPPTVDQKWVGKHQSVESEAWAALMFENTNGQQRVTLKLIDREYKFEPHRHINVPSTSYDAGTLLQDSMEGKNHIGRFAFRNPIAAEADDAGPSSTTNDTSSTDIKPAFRNTGTGTGTGGGGGNPDAFPRMLAPSRGRSMNRSAAGGSFAVKLEQGAYGAGPSATDDKARVKREAGGYFFGDDDDAPRRGRGIERADDEELDYNEDVADDEEAVAMGVDDEELERETKSRLQEEFFRANATAGNLQRQQTPESDDEVDPVVHARKQAELKRERKLRKRLRREKKARGEVGTDDEDDDEDDDSLFGSDDDSSTEGEEEDVKPVVEETKPPITPATSIAPSVGSPTRSRPGSPSTTRMGSARSVSPMASAGAGHHLVASRALSPQGKRSSASSRKRKNDESQTAPPEAGRSSGTGSAGPGALHSFKKSRPNTDAGERRITPSDAEHVPVAGPIDVDVDIKPGTPVPGHPTGLPKHKARGKKKRVDESLTGAGTPSANSPAVAPPRPTSAPVAGAPQAARDGSPAVVGSPTALHPIHGPLTAEEYQEAIAANYDGKITEADFLALLKGKEKMSVKEIRDHFGKRMKKNQRGILSAKFLSWKYCNSVDGGFTLKKEFQ